MQSRSDLLAAAGSRTRRAAVLRAAGGGPIVGLALTRARNPDAPRRVVLGSARTHAEAAELCRQDGPVPVWVRERPGDGWTYTGRWQAVALEPAAGRDDDMGVMHLTGVGQVHQSTVPDG